MKPLIRFPHFNHIPRCRVWIDRVYQHYLALNYAHSGQIRWAVDGGEPRALTAPVAWWTWPGPRFCYGQTEAPGWDHYYVTFQGIGADQLLRSGWIPSVPASGFQFVHQADEFRAKMERLQTLLDHQETDPAWLLLQEMFLDLRTQTTPAAQEGPHEKDLRRLMARIRRQPGEAWSESESAQACGISRAHFRRLFRQLAGLPFHQYCLKARMDAAAGMLRRQQAPLKEVAERCGVPDIYYFTRLFRSHHGVPPGAYAREARMMGPGNT